MKFIWNKNVRNITAKKKNNNVNDETRCNFKPAWPAGTCLIVGDSILTGIDEKRLSRNNQVVKVQDVRGVTIDNLKHHLLHLLKKKPEHIMLHIGTNDAVSKMSRQILDELLQLKQYILNALPTCRVIVSRPTIRTHKNKAVLNLSNFNKLLRQLEVEFSDNVNIKEVHLGKKGLHLNRKGKNRLELNFLQKLRNLWWSTQHLNETYDKSCSLNRSFEDALKNRDNLLNSICLMVILFQPCMN